MRQLPFPALSRLRVQPTHLLPAGMEITSYNHHLRRLLSSPRLCPQTKTTGFNRAFALIQSVLALFARAGGDAAYTMLFHHAERTASHLRRSSPALHHRFVLSAIASAEFCSGPRLLRFDPGANPSAVPFRSRGICRDAGTHSPA